VLVDDERVTAADVAVLDGEVARLRAAADDELFLVDRVLLAVEDDVERRARARRSGRRRGHRGRRHRGERRRREARARERRRDGELRPGGVPSAGGASKLGIAGAAGIAAHSEGEEERGGTVGVSLETGAGGAAERLGPRLTREVRTPRLRAY